MKLDFVVLLVASFLACFVVCGQNPIKHAKDRVEAAQDGYFTEDEIDAAAGQERKSGSYEDMKNGRGDGDFSERSRDFGETDGAGEAAPRAKAGAEAFEANQLTEALDKLRQKAAKEESGSYRPPAAISKRAYTGRPAFAPYEVRIQQVLATYDKDGDGSLSAQEKDAVRQAIQARFGE